MSASVEECIRVKMERLHEQKSIQFSLCVGDSEHPIVNASSALMDEFEVFREAVIAAAYTLRDCVVKSLPMQEG